MRDDVESTQPQGFLAKRLSPSNRIRSSTARALLACAIAFFRGVLRQYIS